jgi:riboflavin kinase/FMN adenylyltransferase
MEGGEVVSSSRIRRALTSGDIATATRLLTRPFAMRAAVQHGDKLGRDRLSHRQYGAGRLSAARLWNLCGDGRLADGRVLKGAANIGIRPHFDPPKELLEPHFFDFSGDLYGQEIEIGSMPSCVRGQVRSLDALVAQIGRDCDEAKRAFEGVRCEGLDPRAPITVCVAPRVRRLCRTRR